MLCCDVDRVQCSGRVVRYMSSVWWMDGLCWKKCKCNCIENVDKIFTIICLYHIARNVHDS